MAKFEALAEQLSAKLNDTSTKIQQFRAQGNDKAAKQAVDEYDELQEHHVTVLMAQASILWEKGQYDKIERVGGKKVCSGSEKEHLTKILWEAQCFCLCVCIAVRKLLDCFKYVVCGFHNFSSLLTCCYAR